MTANERLRRKAHLKKALQTAKQGPFPLAAVFDLDSTLFCMKYRTEAILKSFLPSCQDPALRRALQRLEVSERDWAVEGILERHGLSPDSLSVKKAAKAWRKLFFSSRFLPKDRPYKGAAKFVQKIQSLGAQVFYLTGREKKAMLKGSAASLKKWGFPLPGPHALILKESGALEDDRYKAKELLRLQKQFAAMMFFENEPVILHRAARELPRMRLFWMDSAHSGIKKAPPKKALPLSMDYSL